jgi:hypothetical protein
MDDNYREGAGLTRIGEIVNGGGSMGIAEGPPDARWFEESADSSGTLYYVLPVKPDLAFEFINDAVEPLLGWTEAEGLANAQPLLDVVDDAHAHRVNDILALPPGTTQRLN